MKKRAGSSKFAPEQVHKSWGELLKEHVPPLSVGLLLLNTNIDVLLPLSSFLHSHIFPHMVCVAQMTGTFNTTDTLKSLQPCRQRRSFSLLLIKVLGYCSDTNQCLYFENMGNNQRYRDGRVFGGMKGCGFEVFLCTLLNPKDNVVW